MTTLVLKSDGSGFGWNMLDDFFPIPEFAEYITATSTNFIVHYSSYEYDKFTGSGFTYDFLGYPNGGTIASWVYAFAGVTYFSATGLNMPVVTFMSYYFSADWEGFLEAAFAGNDTITGSTGFDDLYGFDGNDVINGGNDWDIIFGGSGDDKLNGQAWIDELYGEQGNDTLDGGAGADTMFGGTGNDTYILDNAGDIVDEEGNTDSNDTVKSSALITSAFTGIENYIYTGAAAWTFTADDANNLLSGGSAGDKLDGAGGDDKLLGNGGNDTLTGGIGNDWLEGGAGNDKMFGGTGNDTYGINAAGDVITDDGGDDDLVRSSVTVNLAILGAGLLENAFLIGTTAINATGNDLDNELTGNGAANKLNGGIGADTMTGGNGADIYTVDNAGDQVVEATAGAAGGIDLVNSSVDFTLGNNLEKLTLTGTDAIDATGNALNNTLIGNAGANVLDGGAGNDTMTGGKGDDTYVVNSLTDVVNETVLNSAGGGVDEVMSSVTFSLATRANIENLTLTGAGNINGTGNALGNEITGNTGANKLDGGLGADVLKGGAGNDTYIINSLADLVDEEANTDSGDEVKTSALIASAFAGIENYTYTGTMAWSFTGTTVANKISGGSVNDTLNGGEGNDMLLGNGGNDSLAGAEGDDLLDGGAGNDKMKGGIGNDTYVINALTDLIDEEGNTDTDDVVKSSVTVNLASLASGAIEHAILTGTTAINATGSNLDNELTGNSAANKLDGGIGADTMTGGNGADIYTVDNAGDQVIETTGGTAGGIDLVQSYIDFSLAALANVEKVTLLGSTDIDATGNALNNTLIGNAGANVLDGGAGNDTMTGGKGDDTYVVNSLTDVVNETVLNSAGGGEDTVMSSVTFSLATRTNIENLTLTGTGNINGTGNALGNEITGNTGANKLDGGSGNDKLAGDDGNDTLIGGLGNDVLYGGVGADSLNGGAGRDTFDYDALSEAGDLISGFVKGVGGDILNLADLLEVDLGVVGNAFAGGFLSFQASGSNTLVQVDADGGGDLFSTYVTLLNVSLLQTDTSNYILT